MGSPSNHHFSLHDHYDPYDQESDKAWDQIFEQATHGYGQPRKEKKKKIYIERNREEGHEQLFKDYFAEDATYPAYMFRRRFRMNKSLFEKIVEKLSTHVKFFKTRPDGLGRTSHTGLQKCTAAIRMLAYGCSADKFDEYLRIAESTVLLCVENFVDAIISLYGDKYLRRPTKDDLKRLLDVGEARGFPGMIGSIDCMHWEWKNCPIAWAGQYTRGSAKPTIVLEAVASHDLWIWHAFFGCPGTLNDINVLDRSPVFDDILQGRAPPVSYYVNGRKYKLPYYLTDGIYPKWATFMPAIQVPQDPKASVYAEYQEHFRKDVERAFGVLQARFAIIKNPALFWDKEKVGKIMRACIILHNMIVEDERDGYNNLVNVFEFQQGGGSTSQVENPVFTDMDTVQDIDSMMANRNQIRDLMKHEQLKADLIEHVYHKHRPNGN
ncbi:unnamed protein product [Microthlaspi erraticum]|uniref:DDE Tnp4 domain-containing protein n=1 Tax=Microthlaspi erraticum TaxID=1685480 RepID=A0A6D2HRP9_9BRAS|nr:unnamed protein product [Microthlaspi erraticum]